MPYASAVTGLERVTIEYADGTVALREATVLAEPGEVLAVIGPSGSGKSSMLRAIAGLIPPTRGHVLIGGEYTSAHAERRNVAMVFEQTQLIPFLDVAQNMSFPLDLRHVPAERSRQLVRAQARGLRLSRLLARRPATLSRGEQARVGIGRSLVRAPKVFLLDEPLAHLDAGERIRMRRHLRDMVTAAGVTTFYVTHDQSEALAIGDRVAVLHAGALVQLAKPGELYDEPGTTFVATFVGAPPIGLLPARLVVSAGMVGYQVGAHTLPTWSPVPAALDGYRDRPVLIGLRAEDVHQYPRVDDGTITGVVSTLEFTGAHTTLGIRVGEHLLYARFAGAATVRAGATVTVGVDAARAHVFDPATTRALAHPPPGRRPTGSRAAQPAATDPAGGPQRYR